MPCKFIDPVKLADPFIPVNDFAFTQVEPHSSRAYGTR